MKNQQLWLIKKFGMNVNLGNVPRGSFGARGAALRLEGDTLKMACWASTPASK